VLPTSRRSSDKIKNVEKQPYFSIILSRFHFSMCPSVCSVCGSRAAKQYIVESTSERGIEDRQRGREKGKGRNKLQKKT
jgi:hypothetical protein